MAGGVEESVAAVIFCLLGGVMNSTWPLFCKPESPKLIRVATKEGWQWENVWLLFTLWGCLLNIVLCVSVVGESALSAVYRNASSLDLGLVCVFSLLWGSGTMCFSLGIQMLGAGPGTALVMSLLVVIGTLLPLIEDHKDDAGSPAALITMLGLVFAISGFATSAQSSRIKARAIAASQQQQQQPQTSVEKTFRLESCPSDPEVGVTSLSSDSSGTSNVDGKKTTRSTMHVELSLHDGEGGLSSGATLKSSEKTEGAGGYDRHLTGIAVCVAGAVMSSMLQFSFVYGDPLIAYAEDEAGVSGLAAPLVVWLLAFSLAGIWNICYASYLLWINGTWGRYKWEGGGDLCRKWCKLTAMSVFFVGHIHLYGVAQYLFGSLGPVIAWPLLMSSTVLNGQLWGIFMKEWVAVPKLAVSVNVVSICLLVIAVTVIAIAGALL